MVKILFLDIDGVIATSRSVSAQGYSPNGTQGWDLVGCGLVARICRDHGYEIVLSSTWRLLGEDTVFPLLADVDLAQYLHKDWATPRDKGGRSADIDAWMKEHPDVERAISLDDYPVEVDGVISYTTRVDSGITYKIYTDILALDGVQPGVFLF